MKLSNLVLKSNFRDLKPNEKYLLLLIYSSEEYRFTITQLSKLSDIHRANVFRYVNHLGELDFIDLCLIGNVKEIVKK